MPRRKAPYTFCVRCGEGWLICEGCHLPMRGPEGRHVETPDGTVFHFDCACFMDFVVRMKLGTAAE